jgi:hypothetical protein
MSGMRSTQAERDDEAIEKSSGENTGEEMSFERRKRGFF